MGSQDGSIAAFFEALAAAWKANDGGGFASHFTEDGSLINPFGERADGRAALTAMYGEYFAGMLSGTTTSITPTHVRSIGSEYALADADQEVYAPTGEAILSLHVVNLLKREGDGWLLADSRPYAFSELPPA